MAQLIPAGSRIRAGELINRAWKYVQDSCLWSFQLGQGGFSTPALTDAGTISVPFLGSNQMIGDATASAAWQALPFYWAPTLQQIRAQGFSIYSIIAMDTTNPAAVVLTLDRPFIDPLPNFSNVGYMMFQAYIPAPPRFKRWLTVADMFNVWSLDIWTPRRTIDLADPARLYTSNPTMVLGLGQDQRGAGTPNASATLGQQLFELYPNPQTKISYQTYYVAEAPYLVNNNDTLPDPIDEEVVVQKALTWAYRDAEARRDIMAAKGSVGNFLGLKKDSESDFLTRLKTLRLMDRDAVDSYMVQMKANCNGLMPYFNSTAGKANMGGWR
ncbi:MAG TPA: hypothetical protein VN666_21890 [Nitrospira sp.]|nr:hypothetical protein [Nitrospira sp.]